MMPLDDVLARCGVTAATLTPQEQRALDDEGYVVLRSVVDPAWLERLRAAFDRAAGTGAGERGTRHAEGLIDDPAVDATLVHPRVLAAAWYVLARPFQVLYLSGRDPLPGFGAQGLHTDWMARSPGEPAVVATALWLLDEFTAENGATRVVPRSHKSAAPLSKSMQAPDRRHPAQALVLAPAGSVLFFNGHLWHGGTRNESRSPRRILQCQLVARDRAPPDAGPRDPPGRLSREARYILGARFALDLPRRKEPHP